MHTLIPHPSLALPPQEHPLLRRPWAMLHPCQTEALMALLLPAAEGGPAGGTAAVHATAAHATATAVTAAAAGAAPNQPLRYLLAWLSLAGAPLGLRVPPDVLAGP